MTPTELSQIKSFCQVASDLELTSLWQADGLRSGFHASFGGDGKFHIHSNELPDMDQLRSFVMHFRKLTNNNDPSNLRAVANLAFRHNSKSDWTDAERTQIAKFKNRFDEVFRQRADFYSKSDPSVPDPTVESLWLGWVNGEWFHADADVAEMRRSYELDEDQAMSLHLIVPALREATAAALGIAAICRRFLP